MSSRSHSVENRRKQTSQRALKLCEFSGMLGNDDISLYNTFKLTEENNFLTQNENFFNDDENMNMLFLQTLPENIFLPKNGKLQGNKSDGIADLGWAQQAIQALG